MVKRREKLIATACAFFAGAFGAHRFYMYGKSDFWGYWHILATCLGVIGLYSLINMDMHMGYGWVLFIIGFSSLFIAYLSCIVYGLTPDEKWDQKYNHGEGETQTGWAVVIMVSLSLLIGMGSMMAVLAMGFDRYYNEQFEKAMEISQ